ncbi:zinc ABC transporter substrate-binding protein [Nocardia cyriacigeorgica]|uniref:zinc ABC transporter substrate-binding protein AztC n=1 Tax=Nocardia cyriacigeorgica TaxID=135487 RepID=UPI0018937697|nr:zinc ABC transporter substrate-binding protein AztC [Nocardia cyriacigeorgica]MBF6086802.1 zinc ABC transporter substrate-binding protein [Nocardia cyriacigeorgica]MBF6090873.1 zinc ABC transporter substrate-binding protein [Nocardia cyriacigeorgica]MBF6318906.1 zinc ABC transporter substrate-binding protein [Nocardia cyriacigeorgica]MBF6395515.1 zinc ABC transporter substrate-binding protein [Nocardia cyriacigeorgica]MBF6401147.1 zinc ABC transporter substrate-binding protein [Nocardia cyr
MSVLARMILALLAAMMALTGCADSGPDRGAVVVTTDILGDITQAIVGDAAPVSVLMPRAGDPHSFAVSAQQAAGLERAGLIVANGLGLEEGVLRNVEAAADAGVATVYVGAEIDPIAFDSGATAGQPDPHFWTDPQRVRRAVEVIRDRVIEQVPGVDADVVRANADRYLAELDGLAAWMTQRFASVPAERRKLVTNHHVFGYLAQRFGFQVVGAVIPSGTTLASPSPSDLAELAATIRAAGVPTVFADSAQPDRLARVLAEQAGVHVRVVGLHSESLTPPGEGAGSYLEMMRANTDAIVAGLAP